MQMTVQLCFPIKIQNLSLKNSVVSGLSANKLSLPLGKTECILFGPQRGKKEP